MKFITDTLGIEAHAEPWEGVGKLSYYLVDRYEFRKAVLDGIPCLLVKPKGEPDTLTALKMHIDNIRKAEPLPVVLELDNMPARRRKSLIDARIPFIVPECQIYLPFLGVVLNERYTTVKPPKDTLMPSSQLLFFHYLYQDDPELRAGETAELFGLSAMQISRAIRQLSALGLVTVHKDGVRSVISSKEQRQDLFERAKPYLLDPVRNRLYIDYEDLPDGLPLSGYSALSRLTMLSDPSTANYAFFGKSIELNGTDSLVDNFAQAEVEIWRYNPSHLSKHPGVVDTLSLVVSLSHDDDPRVENCIDELLSNEWR